MFLKNIEMTDLGLAVGERWLKVSRVKSHTAVFEDLKIYALQQFLDIEFILIVNWMYESHVKELL